MNKQIQTPAINPQQILSMKATMAADKFAAALRSTKFPQERLSENWKTLAGQSINRASPLSLRIPLKEFIEAMSADLNDLNLFQFGCLSNAIEVVSYDKISFLLDDHQYLETLQESLKHIEYFNLETNKIRAKIEKEVDTEVSMKVAAMNGTVTTGTDSTKAILTPIKGEA